MVDCLSRHPVDRLDLEDLEMEAETEQVYAEMRVLAVLDCEYGDDIIEDRHLRKIKAEGEKDPEYVSLI